tara:strand:- start:680 stop:988 length:309 start_codon:yes stop_codon:yes gene_type:complete
MDSLPIYKTLLDNIDTDSNDLLFDDKVQLVDNIKNNPDTHEIVYVIIKYYYIKNSTNTSNLPYSSKWLKTKSGYKFDIEFIPIKLIKMLIHFYKIHFNSKKT